MKLRIALLQKGHGLEAQKRFAATVMQEAPRHGFVQYFAHHVSARNEAAMTPPSFRSSFKRLVADGKMPDHFKAYSLYHILPDEPCEPERLAKVLNLESAAPIIDHYECVLSIAPYMDLGWPTHRHALSTFLSCCVGLPDTRVAQLLILADATPPTPSPWRTVNVLPFDAFLSGYYDAAYEGAVAELSREPATWDFIELAGRSLAAMDTPKTHLHPASPSSDLIQSVRAICSNAETSAAELSNISKLATNFAGLSWSDHAFGFLKQASTHDPLKQHSHCSTGLLYAPESLNPLRAPVLPEPLKPLHDTACRTMYPESLSTQYATTLRHTSSDLSALPLDSRHTLLFRATTSLLAGDWPVALDTSRALAADTSVYFRKRGIALHALALLRMGAWFETLTYTTSEYVRDFNSFSLLPIAALTEQICAKFYRAFSNDLSVPLLFDIYSRHIAPGHEADRQYAIEDFLSSHGLQRPSQLGPLASKFETAKLVYFLRVVCVPANMDESTAFSGTTDLENERVSICLLLETLDPGGQDTYHTEVKDITRRQVIQRGMRQVEMSKIYVDVDGVRSAAESGLRENFNRYIAFEESGVEEAVEQVIEALRKVTKEGEHSLYVALRLPENEKSEILRGLVGGFRDIFVSSTEHGLDGYLSTRIRHGTLSGQLRSPLQAARLVTQKDADAGRYRANEYWAERVDLIGSGSGTAIGEELAAFSERFDDVVKRINAEWLRVRRYDEDTGLFDFRVFDPLLRVIASHVTEQTSFEEFTNILVTYMWKMLDESLEVIRTKVSVDLKQSIDQLFLQLQLRTQELGSASTVDTSELERAIVTARTEMQRTIARITDWFRLPTQTPNRPYQFRLAIDVAVETVNKYYRDYSLCPAVSVPEELILPGLTLPAVVDIFFIILENIVKHSHTYGPPGVRIVTSTEGDKVHIAVSNDVADGAPSVAVSERLNIIREAITKGEYLQSVPREGGTGFYKIRKIVTHDIGDLEALDFGFVGDSQFLVQIVIRPYKLE